MQMGICDMHAHDSAGSVRHPQEALAHVLCGLERLSDQDRSLDAEIAVLLGM